jgi:uridine kinase
VDALAPVMRGLPGIIVTIDGRDGAGKTTLGRYLAWHFNVTLIETDLFIIPTHDHLIYLDDQINRIIERRVSWPLPVILEGVAMLQLMKRISRVPDFTIYVTNPRHTASPSVKRRLASYEATFNPSASANLMAALER